MSARKAHAGPLVVVPAHGTADVTDEAGALTLLVRAALSRPDRPLATLSETETAEKWTIGTAQKRLPVINANAAVLMDVARDGTALRAAVVVISAGGKVESLVVRSGDGDVRGLAEGIVRHVASATGALSGAIPYGSLGELRPLVRSTTLLTTSPAALTNTIAQLSIADPVVAVRVAPGLDRLRTLQANTSLTPTQKVLATRVVGTPSDLTLLSKTAPGPIGTAAAAMVDFSAEKLREFDAILRENSPDPAISLARVLIAHRRNDAAARDRVLLTMLATDNAGLALQWAATVPARSLSPTIHKTMIGVLEKALPTQSGLAGVAAKLGLAAAEIGIEKEAALALISVRELDEAELGRLEALLPDAPERIKLRLNAEFAMRRNDPTVAAAIEAFASGAPADARARLYKGRQLMAEKLYREAANEFAIAGATVEQSRALALSGNLAEAIKLIDSIDTSKDTAEVLVWKAQIALANGKVDEAAALLTQAEGKAPVSGEVTATLVRAGGKSTDAATKAYAKDLAKVAATLAPSSTSVDVADTGASTVTAGNNAAQATAANGGNAEPEPEKVVPDPDLASLLDRLEVLNNLPGRDVVAVNIPWSTPIWSLRTVEAAKLKPALRLALSQAPRGLRVVEFTSADVGETVDKSTLRKLTGDRAAVIFYQVMNDGGDPKVRLIAYPAGSLEGEAIEGKVKSSGVVGLALGKLIVLASIGGVFFLVGMFFVIRGSGDIDVRYKLDADSKDEAFGIIITKEPRRPRIDDPKKFFTDAHRAGQTIESRKAILVSGHTKFRVPPGDWSVVLYGVYDRDGQLTLVPDSFVKPVEVKRGKTAMISFDLVPKEAELRVTIHGTQVSGIGVWLNDSSKRVYTDATGTLTMPCPIGSHNLHIEVGGKVFDRQLHITTPRIERVSINLEREMQLASLANGWRDPAAALAAAGAGNPPPAGPAARGSQPVTFHAGGATPAAAVAAAALSPTQMAAASIASIDLGLGAELPSDLSFLTDRKNNETGGVRIADIMQGNAAANATALLPNSAGAPYADAAPQAQEARAPSGIMKKSSNGRLLSRYEIKRELGRGAMGVVYRAWDINLERDVAIKVLAKELRSHPEALKLFQQEAKALAQMNHGNIVSVFDQVTDADEVYLILEFVDGATLDDILQERKLFPWVEACSLIDQLCAGLAYAHNRQVIHRDIKPANIFITKEGTVKLGDFGLARVVREVTIRKTEIRGTPLYMAPEQITGRDIDMRADLYAVGCTFFELVTGRPPFIDGEILYAQLHEKPPSPLQFAPDLEPKVAELILHMIAKAADDRPKNAEAVRNTLRNIMSASLL